MALSLADREDQTETLGDRVRRLRQERGWSLDETVRQTGLSRGAIAGTETGRTTYTKPITLELLAQAFGVPAYYLQTGVWPSEAEPPSTVPLDTYLRQSSDLSEEQIGHMSRTMQALEAERKLEALERRVAESQGPHEVDTSAPGITELDDIPGEPRAAHPKPPPQPEEWPPKEEE